MYPLYLKYTTTLPCNTTTMKITIFIIVLVLKLNENMEIWHLRLSQLANSSKPCRNSLFQDVFKVFNPRQIPSTSWRKSCKQYGMICHRTPPTRSYWASSKDFQLVQKLRADTIFKIRPVVAETLHIVWWSILFWDTLYNIQIVRSYLYTDMEMEKEMQR